MSLAETLTFIVSSAKAASRSCHSFSWRHALRSTKSVSATIRPASSAIAMKVSGLIAPSSGWFQRASASKPVMRPELISNSGW